MRTGEGRIIRNYVGRMNRGIEESVALGLPRSWVDKVMRRWVVPGIFPEYGYIGTNKGYVPEAVENGPFQERGSDAEQPEPPEA